MAALSEFFETKYARQQVLKRERSIPLDGYMKDHVTTTYDHALKIDKEIEDADRSKPEPQVFWSNDEPDSLFKIGYPDKYANQLVCNENLNEDDDLTDKDGNNLYYTYNCFNWYKLLYKANLKKSSRFFNFTLNTPEYTPDPYEYVYYIEILGRRMNSFNMYLSSRLAKFLEQNIVAWAAKRGVAFESLHSTQLVTVSDKKKKIPLSSVKIQMSVHPKYFYWVVETLIRNYDRLNLLGMEGFKFLYLIGEFKLNLPAEVYPNPEEGVGIDTYGKYRRELLNPPNVVFYLRDNANIKKIADTLCRLFPEKYDLAFGVPRFNMRLNRNVYISFGGNNETKFNMTELFTPKEYERILETKNPFYNDLSEKFSGHTLMLHNGRENNIQSYKKLIPFIPGASQSSFQDVYDYYGLLDYYNEVFGDFNREYEAKAASVAAAAAQEVAEAAKAKSAPKSFTKRRSKSLSHVRTVRILSKPRAKSLSRSNSNSKTNSKTSNKVKSNIPAKPLKNRNSFNNLYD